MQGDEEVFDLDGKKITITGSTAVIQSERALVTFRTGRSDSGGLRGGQPERGHQRCGRDVAGRIVHLFQVQFDGLGKVR